MCGTWEVILILPIVEELVLLLQGSHGCGLLVRLLVFHPLAFGILSVCCAPSLFLQLCTVLRVRMFLLLISTPCVLHLWLLLGLPVCLGPILEPFRVS